MFLLIIGCIRNSPVSPEGWIEVQFPNGGETFAKMSHITVRWTSIDVQNVDIYLVPLEKEIIHQIGWRIPAQSKKFRFFIGTETDLGAYKIRVEESHAPGEVYAEDESDGVWYIVYY